MYFKFTSGPRMGIDTGNLESNAILVDLHFYKQNLTDCNSNRRKSLASCFVPFVFVLGNLIGSKLSFFSLFLYHFDTKTNNIISLENLERDDLNAASEQCQSRSLKTDISNFSFSFE